MRFVVLLRWVNVGTSKRVEMKRFRVLLESLGYENVSTYLNSGNAQFEFEGTSENLVEEIRSKFVQEFGFEVPMLVKSSDEMRKIAEAVPAEWNNDGGQRTDVAYLFPEIDSEKILEELPFKKGFVDARYIPGAVLWNILRSNYWKSGLNKIAGHKAYRLMTVRNINTARFLWGAVSSTRIEGEKP